MASDENKKKVFDALHGLKNLAAQELGEGHPFNGKLDAVFPALEVHVKDNAPKTPEVAPAESPE